MPKGVKKAEDSFLGLTYGRYYSVLGNLSTAFGDLVMIPVLSRLENVLRRNREWYPVTELNDVAFKQSSVEVS